MSARENSSPLLVVKSVTGTGTVRVRPRKSRREAAIEVLDSHGGITQVRMTPDELRLLAKKLFTTAAHLDAFDLEEEITQH